MFQIKPDRDRTSGTSFKYISFILSTSSLRDFLEIMGIDYPL